MDAFAWAHQRFWYVRLPDLRLNRRLVDTAACIRRHPSGTLPASIEGDAARKWANRLFNHPEVTFERVIQPHLESTRTQCKQPGEFLLIEDTTALSFSKRAIHSVVAYELLQLKLLARNKPNTPIQAHILAPENLTVLEKKYGRPAEGWTHHTVLITMGGYLGRKNDGPPGWQTLWRGYHRLLLMTEGYLLTLETKTCG